jgi:cytochrome c peroxidase
MTRVLVVLVLLAGSAAAAPLGLPPLEIDASPGQIELGRKLFLDRRLSHNGTMSCAMCHVPEQGFTSNELQTPIGVEGRSLRRNSPTLLNVAHVPHLFHDGRETGLETQALAPLIARDEMANHSLGMVLARIEGLPDYAGMFEAAFGAGPSLDRLGQALAAFQRTLLAANSRFDRWRYGGEAEALSEQQVRGFELFTGRAGCVSCHTIAEDHALLTDNGFHDTGIGHARARGDEGPVPVMLAPGVVVPVARSVLATIGDPPAPDSGRLEVTGRPEDLWRYRTPSLRNVALTAPYMHDGSLPTLEAVVRWYDEGGAPSPGLDARIRPLGLDDDEVDAIVAFLESLTGDNVQALARWARTGER